MPVLLTLCNTVAHGGWVVIQQRPSRQFLHCHKYPTVCDGVKPLFMCFVVSSDPPVLTSTPADNTHSVKFGDDLHLSCSANGTLPIKMTWFHNGVELIASNRIVLEPLGHLTVHNASTSSDSGVYQCYAENEAGFTSHTVLVDVFSELALLSARCHLIVHICF